MDKLEWVPWIVLPALLPVAAWFLALFMTKRSGSKAQQERKRLLEEAQRESELIKAGARDESREWIEDQRQNFNQELKEARRELKEAERRLSKREDSLERKMDLLNKKEKKLERDDEHLRSREEDLGRQQNDLEQLIEEEKNTLYRITQLTKAEAEKLVLERTERDLDHEKDVLIARMVERVKEEAERRAHSVLATVIQRCASTYTQEITTSSIELPNDEMKGRVIGREGRNIRAF
ncbi:MAG: DUF3552 domain-containing protein [Planctomycetes bacterium]|nr:DUF3552 domain-containing protein [Planctomycetota bacterium]